MINSEDSNAEELNTHIGNTNWCTSGNCSKMEHQHKVFVVFNEIFFFFFFYIQQNKNYINTLK